MSSTEPIPVPRAQLFFARLMRATPGLWTGLGNLETRILGSELDQVKIVKPIFVTGLARSGTTIVTELLSLHQDVASHHYSDFPLVWTPYWWNSLRANLPLPQHPPAERAHQDRIQVTPDSPEAVEEVLWMRFFKNAHDCRVSQVLDASTKNPDFEAFYRAHIRKLLRARGANRYLAKGNYNMTRLAYLRKLFPDARFVIMVRDPVWHIASLMKQDRLFCEQHEINPKVTDYLKLLGHFEFGMHKQPINVGDNDLVQEVGRLWSTDEAVRGWALYWRSIYGFIQEQLANYESLAAACLIVRFEDLCADPIAWSRRIIEHCGLGMAVDLRTFDEFAATISAPGYYEPAFTSEELNFITEATGNPAHQFGYKPADD